MLKKLTKDQFQLLDIYKELKYFPLIHSVIKGLQSGQIFVDDHVNPTVALVMHKCSFGYLWHSEGFGDFDDLFEFIHINTDIPRYFHLYNTTKRLENYVARDKRFNFKLRSRMRMESNPNNEIRTIDLGSFKAKTIQEIDVSLLRDFNISGIENYWNDVTDFVSNGVGWVIFDQDKPVSIFYSLCIVEGNSETDIFTLDEYRGKGLASIAGSLILKTLKEMGIRMDWDVFVDNIGSIKIGEKFGYKAYLPYNFLSIYKNDI